MTPFRAGAREAELVVRPVRGARGLRLSVDAVRGRVLLTHPPRSSRRAALAWAETRRAWVEQVLADAPAPRPFVPGAILPWDGADLAIEWCEGASRTVCRVDDRLICGGPREHIERRVEGWARREALKVLAAETTELAGRAGVEIGAVRVGDPRSRWGSCSARGAISYSWRLLLAPPFVRRAVVAHEVAHRLYMNHGPAFHRAHQAILGTDPSPANTWLRQEGAQLFLFGRG